MIATQESYICRVSSGIQTAKQIQGHDKQSNDQKEACK